MFNLKNSIDWEVAQKGYLNGNTVYCDEDNYDRLLSIPSWSETDISYELDQMFGGDWSMLDAKNYDAVNSHYLHKTIKPVTSIFNSVITQTEAREYYLLNIESMAGYELTSTLYKDSNAQRYFINTNPNIGGTEISNTFGGNWFAFSSISDVQIAIVLGISSTTDYKADGKTLVDSFKSLPKLGGTTNDVESPFQRTLYNFLGQFETLLVSKNKAYGNSALQPVSIFSKASSSDVILQQIDHKLSRIKNSDTPKKNDVIDLMGYLTLYCLDQSWTNLDDISN